MLVLAPIGATAALALLRLQDGTTTLSRSDAALTARLDEAAAQYEAARQARALEADAGLEIAGVGRVSADAWNGSWLPRDGLPAGTTSAAGLVYQLPQDVTVEELTAGEGHLDAGVPFDVSTGDRLGDGLDLTFAWQPE